MAAQIAIELPPVLAFIVGAPAAPRETVESLIQAAINALDELDGDPDLETNDGEDDFVFTAWAMQFLDDGPGCPIADAGGQCDEDGINTHDWHCRPLTGPGCALSDPGGNDEEGWH